MRRASFLTRHNDAADASLHRRVAYVLSFNENLASGLGRAAAVLRRRKRPSRTCFVPRFNSLSLFTVPQFHACELRRTLRARSARLAITGWFQDP